MQGLVQKESRVGALYHSMRVLDIIIAPYCSLDKGVAYTRGGGGTLRLIFGAISKGAMKKIVFEMGWVPFFATTRWAMRQRKLGSHTPPCHRRMVITTLFSVLLAALQRRPVLYHTRWLLTVCVTTRWGWGVLDTARLFRCVARPSIYTYLYLPIQPRSHF